MKNLPLVRSAVLGHARHVILCLLTVMIGAFPCLAEDIRYPVTPGVVDVTQAPYYADKTGVADATAAIQSAISANVNTRRILYFPNGTYKISNSLFWKNGSGTWYSRLTLQGQSRAGVVLALVDGAAGFGNATTPKAVIVTGSQNPVKTDGSGNQAFQNSIRNLTIDVGSGNPGAVGIDYLANNYGSVKDVTIKADPNSGFAGILMTREWPGPALVKNVSIEGFDYGVKVGTYEYSMTFEDLSLSGQRINGIYSDYNVLSIRNLTSVNSVPAVRIAQQSASRAVIVGASLTGGNSTQAAIVLAGKLLLLDATISGYGTALDDIGTSNNDLPMSGSPTMVGTYVSHEIERLSSTMTDTLRLPVEETPAPFLDDPSLWADVTAYGATAASGNDDTSGIQAALNSGKPTVFFPRGTYHISNTLTVPSTVRRIVGIYAVLDQTGTSFNNASTPKPVFLVDTQSANPLHIESMTIGSNLGKDGCIAIQQSAPRTIVVVNAELAATLKHGFLNTVEGGRFFIEDAVVQRVKLVGDVRFWGRQWNSEAVGGTAYNEPQLDNQGGVAWILGLKTEGQAVITRTAQGGYTELLGGFVRHSSAIPTGLACHEIVEAEASLSWKSLSPTYPWTVQVRETRNGVTQELLRTSVPTSGNTENVILFAGWMNAYLPFPGLSAAWPFDGDALDASGNLRHLSTVNAIFDPNDKKQGTHSLDLSAAGANGTGAAFDVGNRFSIAAWVYLPTNASNSRTILANMASGSTGSGFKFFVNTASTIDGKVHLQTVSNSTQAKARSVAGAFVFGSWNHVAATVDRDAAITRVYVNGVDRTEASVTRNNFTTNATIHVGQMSGGTYRLGGKLDNLLVYQDVLSPEMVGELAVAGPPAGPVEPLVFSAASFSAYSSGQDGQNGLPTSVSVSPEGLSVSVAGNAWKHHPLTYTVTANTILEVTINSADTGEITAIGLDSDNSHTTTKRMLRLGGTQTDQYFFDISPTYVAGSGAVTYVIPLGSYFTGAMSSICFVADDDANGSTSATFSNIKIYEP